MSILSRSALEESPLADLHLIASELSIDGYRRLRKAELVDAILERQQGGGESAEAPSEQEAEPAEQAEPEREPEREAEPEQEAEPEDEAEPVQERPATGATRSRRRGRRGGRGRGARDDAEEPGDEEPTAEEPAEPEPESEPEPEREPAVAGQVAEGVVELLPNGSGFLRVSPPEPSDSDVYISAAQVKRCELVAGDRIAGPRRPPRRSERFASLVRIDTINGRPASDVAEGPRFDDLPAAFPQERLRLGSEDPTVKAIEWLTPVGKGSRVTITGEPRAGKTETLRRIAHELAGAEGDSQGGDELQVLIALAGVRPEEIPDWADGPLQPTAAASMAASAEAQANAVERVVDQARRLAGRGGDVVVVIDTLDGLEPAAARRALASARNIVDGGSLTVIATASHPLGGETTVIALDARLTATGRFPALDLASSGTIRPELLVGEAGAEAIARARAEAAEE